MSHFSIAGLQLKLESGDNLDVISKHIVKTKKRFPWVDMIVLTELCTYGPEKKYASSFPSQAEHHYQKLCIDNNVWLITGSQYEQDGDDIYNTSTVINNLGEIVTRYRKIFPFLPYESGVKEGSDIVTFDVPGGRIGIAICYDLWFPEVARAMVCDGADVLIFPTLTGTIDRPLELIMSQSTAVMNQCYVFGINASEPYGTGQSIVVEPDGNVIYQANIGEEIIPIEIDFERVKRVRTRGGLGLGQPLKSLRDNPINFSKLTKKDTDYLDSLGPLTVPLQDNADNS
ncbi:carbon-nitrogen hydrolase family protein [Psychrosphaera sp. B3R10]|uniref:carbon-nitrogen hydrolase family protein n=1 Tax=unclassified Psychrosphaera TaxID=2641570 RepID=UPI001C083C2A|nr:MULTISPECIES: carbon-nitrogen hydrolase family protein [unclassified Psychrosphaera]MBU2880413.1 carbon-nitrogen hydrolase family protein [Psychrosphaera sp. I2R16]MBU2987852.1 carbon-nitrogen hydrolase family protein [Psychrosphaera sp. B3R10]